jgi:HEAT repeat protein
VEKSIYLNTLININIVMPKRVDKQSKRESASPKKNFSQTEANLPMTDSIEWRKRILEGTKEERLVAIKEAVDKDDEEVILALPEVLLDQDKDLRDAAVEALDYFKEDPRLIEIVHPLIEASKSKFHKVREIVARVFQDTSDVRTFDCLVVLLEDESLKVRREAAHAIGMIAASNPSYPELSKAVPLLIQALKEKCRRLNAHAAWALGNIGNKKAIKPLKNLLNTRYFEVRDDVESALQKLGLTKGQISQASYELQKEKENEMLNFLQSSDQMAVYRLLEKNRDIKKIVFENAEVLETLPNKQAWITINDPQLARDALKLTLEKLGNKRNSLENALGSALGVKIKQLEDSHFKYYADEILDNISQVVINSKLRNDKELSALLSQIRHGNGGVQLRYIKRELADLSLGDKCGDCTAKGSVNFGNSVTWLVNPAYQILKLSKGKRFIGKINFTLGTLEGREAIIIDALEFNPQAQQGKPYHEDALECFDIALSFLKGLARKEKRKLYALAVSNSSGAVQILKERGHQITSTKSGAETDENETTILSLIIPSEDVSKMLASTGHEEGVSMYYQMLDSITEDEEDGTVDSNKGGRNLADEKLPLLEREIINPAQISNREIATAMRERDFEKASKLILADSELERKVKEIFRLPEDLGISPKFLSVRLEKIFKTEVKSIESLKRNFIVSAESFVKL